MKTGRELKKMTGSLPGSKKNGIAGDLIGESPIPIGIYGENPELRMKDIPAKHLMYLWQTGIQGPCAEIHLEQLCKYLCSAEP